MGIRFLCQHCQRRLNVKDRQAGQFCLCPDCREEIQIPLASTIGALTRKRKKRKRRRPAEPKSYNDSGVSTESVSSTPGDYLTPPEQPTSAAHLSMADSTDSASGQFEKSHGGVGVADREPEIREPQACDVDHAAVEDHVLFDQQVADKADGNLDQTDQPVSESGSVIDALDALTKPAKMREVAESIGSNASVVSDTGNSFPETNHSFLLAKPVAKIEQDPLKSNPKLVWYVRHRRLGEKGPLKAKKLEALLESGQLRPGTILWREDWNEWLAAEEVFPQLAVKSTTEAAYEIPDELNPHSDASKKRRAQKRFWMGFNAAAFLLVIVLFYWLTLLIR